MTEWSERTPPRTRIVTRTPQESTPRGRSTAVAEPPTQDERVYEGWTFTGRYLGESRRRGLADSAETQQTERAEQSPVIDCPHCDTPTRWLSGTRFWCPRCKTPVRRFEHKPVAMLATVIAMALLIALAVFYARGSFDRVLYAAGLNWETCAQASEGAAGRCDVQIAAGSEPGGWLIKSGFSSRLK